MKRDLEYMVDILRDFEKDDMDTRSFHHLYSKREPKEIHHLRLLCDEGMVEEIDDKVYRITKWGHDFLDSVDKGRLERIKEEMKDEFGSSPLEIISSIGLKILKSNLGL